jgi:hypothetical protein
MKNPPLESITQKIHQVHKSMPGRLRPKSAYGSIRIPDHVGDGAIHMYGWIHGDVMVCHLGPLCYRLMHIPTQTYFFQSPVLSFTSQVCDLLIMSGVDFLKIVVDKDYRFEINQALLDRMPGMKDCNFFSQHYHHSPTYEMIQKQFGVGDERKN